MSWHATTASPSSAPREARQSARDREIVATVHGDHRRNPQVTKQRPQLHAGSGMGLGRLGVDHECDDVDVALQDVGHEPEPGLARGSEEQQPCVIAVEAVRPEVHGDRGVRLDVGFVAAGDHIGRDHLGLRHRLDHRRLAGRERPGDEDLEGLGTHELTPDSAA